MAQGMATAYSLDSLQERGKLLFAHGDEVYEGMIVGENPRTEDMPVNPTKEKQLSNVRSQGEGKGIQLTPPIRFWFRAGYRVYRTRRACRSNAEEYSPA